MYYEGRAFSVDGQEYMSLLGKNSIALIFSPQWYYTSPHFPLHLVYLSLTATLPILRDYGRVT